MAPHRASWPHRRLFILLALLALPALGWADPTLTELLLPQTIQGSSGTNNNRTPYAFRVRIDGLTPSTDYRYFNQAVVDSDTSVTNGSGNPILVHASGTFTRISSTGMVTAGQYGTFTSDASGSYSGWFMLEPTSNARFASGNTIRMRINMNDGVNTSVTTRLTTSNTVQVMTYGATASDGTAAYCPTATGTPYVAKNFIFLYDNEAGSGRPVAGASIESDGATGQSSYATFYQSYVEAQAGAWGTIVPNSLASGILRLEQRAFADGSIVSEGTVTDADGTWPAAGTTTSPTGGTTTPIVFGAADLPVELSSFDVM